MIFISLFFPNFHETTSFLIFAYLDIFCVLSWFFKFFYDICARRVLMTFVCIFINWHNFWILMYLHKVDNISWFLCIFMMLAKLYDFYMFQRRWQNFMFFGFFYEVGNISWFLCVFYEVGKISWFLCFFYEVGKISWFLCTFMKLTKFYDFFVISWSWQNLMIFVKIYEIGKIP